MITKKIIIPLIVIVILSGVGGVLTAKEMSDRRLTSINTAGTAESSATGQEAESPQPTDNSATAKGRYAQYEQQKVSESGFNTTILFFYAAWCPECRSFKQAITNSAIPDGTQVLEVNYDSSSDLKKQHGVTLQSTFVKVSQNGDQQSKWVGYGKEKSLQAILKNL